MVNYFFYRLGQSIALSLPRKVVYRIAVFLSDLHYIFVFRDRLAVRENLRIIFPQKSAREVRQIRIQMFRNFAKYLVDFFRFSTLDKEFMRKNIKIENMHYLDEALAKGKGAITVTAHLGNWELGGALIGSLGYPFWVVALEHKHKKVNDFFDTQRLKLGVHVIPLGRAVRECLRVLKENKVLGLVGDKDFNQNGIILDLFGKPTFFPQGPATFAVKTGASLIPGFMLRNSDDTFTFRLEKPLEVEVTGDLSKDRIELMKKYKTIFEDYIRRYPEQWYMFRRFRVK